MSMKNENPEMENRKKMKSKCFGSETYITTFISRLKKVSLSLSLSLSLSRADPKGSLNLAHNRGPKKKSYSDSIST